MPVIPRLRLCQWLIVATGAIWPGIAAAQERVPVGEELFQRRIRPLLKEKCLACHGEKPDELKGRFDLRSRGGMLKGGESGNAAIVPGKPDASPLYLAVARKDDATAMPPKENDKLTEQQVAWVRQWIEAGAPWSDAHVVDGWGDEAAGGMIVKTTPGRSPEWTNRLYQPDDLWAYRPLRVVEPPKAPLTLTLSPPVSDAQKTGRGEGTGQDETIAEHPVDAFLRERLAAKGVSRGAAEADRRTLIRRVTFDLTGLPPSVDDVNAFVRDESSDAYSKLVKRLLASSHYGEQQARHWLDVVRYADTAGLSNDFERPHAWRYRDYVVRSFNTDKPYDRFVVEQLAGDELIEERASRKEALSEYFSPLPAAGEGSGVRGRETEGVPTARPLTLALSPQGRGEGTKPGEDEETSESDLLIATGFLRMGPWEHTGMTVAAITRQDFLDDVTHHVGVTLLGQGLRCARCHDHKFDPVPTADYYRIQSVFATTQFVERPVPFQPHENTSDFAAHREVSERRLKQAQDVLAGLKQKVDVATAEFLRERGVTKLTDLADAERPGLGFGLTKHELSIRKINQKRGDYFERELKRFEPFAFAVYSGPTNGYASPRPLYKLPVQREGEIPVVHILPGGALETPADPVTPGVLSVANSFVDAAHRASNDIPDEMAGRRLAFARWVVSRDNPLTARVLVNRVWQQHFGRGLVATPNNFGKMGARPTHPELLDWLAAWLVDHDWSLKQLHELIVTSATYRQSGEHPDIEKLLALDAKNELLAYFPARRLVAEEIRDAMLAVAGELNRELLGPGVFPELNREVAAQPRHIMGSVAPAYQPSPKPEQRNRRTLYAFRYRTLSDPFLEVFNRPGSEISCECRDQTTVTPQVFALFNSESSHQRALAFARRIEQRKQALPEQIDLAFQTLFARAASRDEITECREHVALRTADHRQRAPQRSERPTSYRRHMIEEMTGELMEWDEPLETTGYVSDLQPADVSPETRALADLCLVLMNSNEFLYVR